MCRKLIYVISFVVVLSLAGSAQADLVAYWMFDEGSGTTAHDSSGNGHDGTIYGATWIDGYLDGGLQFDGTDDSINFGTGASLDGPTDFSVTAWIKTAMTSNGAIIQQRNGGWNGEYRLMVMGSGVLNLMVYGGGYQFDGFETTATVNDGQWHHVAAGRSGTTGFIYIDGVLEATTEGTLVNLDDTIEVAVGQDIRDSVSPFDGIIDEVRIYDAALSEAEIWSVMTLQPFPFASTPDPEDNSMLEQAWVSLNWRAGDLAVSHDVYMGENFDDVNEGTGDTFRGNHDSIYFVVGFSGYPYPDGLVPGTTYYWRIDEVNQAELNSPWKGPVWSFWIPTSTAHDPEPADGSTNVLADATLNWTAGLGASMHYLYFGDNPDDVNNAVGAPPTTDTTYSPDTLELDKTYYWRVDEFDIVTGITHKGDLWSFQMLPDIPISDPNLEGWWKLDEGAGLTAVDWSGHGNHATLMNGANWVDAYDGGGVKLDQDDDYVDTGYTTNLPIWTISAWVESPDEPSGRTNSGPVHRESNFQINWDHTDPVFRGAVAVNAGGFFAASFGPLKADTWYHLAATYDGSELIAYTNGVLVNSNPGPSGDPASESASLKLGRHAAAAQYLKTCRSGTVFWRHSR